MPDPSSLAHPAPPRHLKRAAIIAACIAGAVVAVGVITRVNADQSLKGWTRDQAIPTVALADVQAQGAQALTLPGNIQAFTSAPIHARTNGYLKRWYVDIGQPVKAGQLLADIDTPDLDQQVLQARADLATAQANESLARTTSARWAGLLSQDAVSKQEADEKAGDLAARASAANSAKANLNRLLALEGFKRILAPFDGVVTSRNTDVGALISPGGPTDTALFTVADQHRLRIYVNVPQSYSAQVKPGITADVTVPEYPGETFKATLAHDAQAINGQSGTLLVELQIDNPGGRLKPGSYAQVSFKLPSAAAATTVPASALMYRHDGPVVAVLGANEHVALRSVTISRDLGSSVQIGSGLKPSDRVIDNPPESIAAGDLVRVVKATAPKTGPANAKG
jgi:RND family efflux transporter MFP subunit